MADETPRLTIPYILASQSQKEVTHNEGLNLLDIFIQPAVETASLSTPPGSPGEGELWIIGSSPTGGWAGHEDDIARFIDGGWSFHAPFEGMAVWQKDTDLPAMFLSGMWQDGIIHASQIAIGGVQVVGGQQSAISDAAGGATIDTEARSALNGLLAACRLHGLIST